MSESPRQTRQSGQAAVESALVLPLMVLLGLGLLQLMMMQHAKLMTEYAAYCAARAGIVWNGSNERMHDAALVALLPTLGRTDGLPSLARTWTRARLHDELLQGLAWPTKDSVVPASVNGANLFGVVRVDTVSPSGDSLVRSVWKPGPTTDGKELDFDSGLDEGRHREATVLSVRVRYWYELRVPLANWFIFTSWWAANAGVALGGALYQPTLDAKARLTHRKGGTREVGMAPVRGLEHQRGYSTLYRPEMTVLWGLATGGIPTVSERTGKRYFLPLTATYSMRMQSNFYFKWLMHLDPDRGSVAP
ncbi:MAG: TadE/TadG family type IV pilus assembly protein [Archangium sp.]